MAFFKVEKRKAAEQQAATYAERWVSRRAVAEHFGVDEKTVRRNGEPFKRIRRNKLGGSYRYSLADVLEVDRELEAAAYAIDGDGAAVEAGEREEARAYRVRQKENLLSRRGAA